MLAESQEVEKSNFRQYGQMRWEESEKRKSEKKEDQRRERKKKEDQRTERVSRKKIQVRKKVEKLRSTVFYNVLRLRRVGK